MDVTDSDVQAFEDQHQQEDFWSKLENQWKEMAETKTGSLLTTSDKREISALITFKGGLVCSFGNGKVIVLQVQTSKDDDDIRFKVADIIKLPIRNPTTAGKIFKISTITAL